MKFVAFFLGLFSSATGLIVLALCLWGWLVHIYICFTAGLGLFLIAGAIMPPIGIVHGWGHILGVW